MRYKLLPIVLSVFVLALGSLACQALSGDSPTATTVPDLSDPQPVLEPTQPPVLDAPILPDSIQPQGTGMACMGLREGGLACLDESGWKTFNDENSDLPTNYLNAGSLCPDGRFLIAHYDGLSLFDGSRWENIPATDGYSSADSVACGADGSLWVAHFQGVSRYSEGQWTTFGSELLATGESANQLVYDISAAPDGQIWVATSRSIASFTDGEWTVYQEGQGFYESVFFNALAIDSLGRIWAGMSSGVAVFENSQWVMIDKPGYSSPSTMVFDARGKLWLGTAIDGVSTFDGNSWSDLNRANESLPADNIKDIAADSLGRVWLATTYGLVVVENDQSRVFRMDNSGIPDNETRFVLVLKDGPTLPAEQEQPSGSLTGKLEKADTTPLSGMRVEICVESLGSQFSGETPCSDQPFFLSTQTDDSGTFTFANVPAGYYVLVAETGDGWAQLTTEFGIGSERTRILPAESYDIGTLTLEEEE